MPSAEQIQIYVAAAWHLILGRRGAIKQFDLSADGFWNSFYAMIVVLPMMLVTWVTIANGFGDMAGEFGGRLSIVLRLAFIDLLAWVAPIVVLAFSARALGIADRFVPYVVASNWGSVITSAIMLPVSLIELVFPGSVEALDALSLVVFIVAMVVNWRLANASIDRGTGVAAGAFGVVVVVSIAVVIGMQSVMGLVAQPG
ncbi:MAG: transporter [Mesorhizobium sp.]